MSIVHKRTPLAPTQTDRNGRTSGSPTSDDSFQGYVRHLQSLAGNQAVCSLIRAELQTTNLGRSPSSDTAGIARPTQNLSQMGASNSQGTHEVAVQRRIGVPGPGFSTTEIEDVNDVQKYIQKELSNRFARVQGELQRAHPQAGAAYLNVLIASALQTMVHDPTTLYVINPTNWEQVKAFFDKLRHLLSLEPELPALTGVPEAAEMDRDLDPASSSSSGGEDDSGVSDEEDAQAVAPLQKPRRRMAHKDSEGESESEDPAIVWRALRKEESPWEEGLRPPKKHNKDLKARQHITAGSRARMKSGWVSTSRSRKVAAAWASESPRRGAKASKRVVKARIREEQRGEQAPTGDARVIDLTDPEQASKVFPAMKGTSLNTALSSQEVVIYGGIDKGDVLEEFESRVISKGEYSELKVALAGKTAPVMFDGREVYAAFLTRREVEKKGKKLDPKPRVLLRVRTQTVASATPPPPTAMPSTGGVQRRVELLAVISQDEPHAPIDNLLLDWVLTQAIDIHEAAAIYLDVYWSMG